MTQLMRGRNDASLRHGSHDDMRSRTHGPLWNVNASTRGLDIRPGAGIAKNGEGERLGAAIRGDDVRFARQHDRLQFAGGVDECECIAPWNSTRALQRVNVSIPGLYTGNVFLGAEMQGTTLHTYAY